MADTDPELQMLRDYARVVRAHAGYMVLTVHELLTLVSLAGEVGSLGDGRWFEQLPATRVYPYSSLNLLYKTAFHRKPRPELGLGLAMHDANSTYRFARQLQYHQAMDAIGRREPQTLIEGIRSLVTWRVGLTEIGASQEFDGPVIVVPDDPSSPVLTDVNILQFTSLWWSDDEWLPMRPATVYPLEAPKTPASSRWPAESSPVPARAVPIDVLTAAAQS